MLGSDSRTKTGSGSGWQPARHPQRATASRVPRSLFVVTKGPISFILPRCADADQCWPHLGTIEGIRDCAVSESSRGRDAVADLSCQCAAADNAESSTPSRRDQMTRTRTARCMDQLTWMRRASL